MIYIGDCFITHTPQQTVVKIPISINQDEQIVHFTINEEITYTDSTTIYNAALIGMLPLSFEKQMDIECKNPVCAVLLKNIREELLLTMGAAYETTYIPTIKATSIAMKPNMTGEQYATGFSCGVDSLSTLLQTEKEIAYLTFFNAGSHGKFLQEKTSEIADFRYSNARKAASEFGEKLIRVDTNLSEFTKQKFQDNHSFLQIACAHILHPVINYYSYSTGQKEGYKERYGIDKIYLNNFCVHLLSSSSLTVDYTLSDISRFDRTKIIANSPIAQQYLDVCVDTHQAIKSTYQNCSKCDKCMRTQLTLELLGTYDQFSTVFDKSEYNIHKNKFLAHIKMTRNKDQLNRELYEEVKKGSYYNFHTLYWELHLKKRLLKKRIKKLF